MKSKFESEITAVFNSTVIDADILTQDLLINLDNELNRLSEMEANVKYGIFDFREIQKKLAQKIK